MKKPNATKKAVKQEKEEVINPLYGLNMEQAIDKIVKAGKPDKEKK